MTKKKKHSCFIYKSKTWFKNQEVIKNSCINISISKLVFKTFTQNKSKFKPKQLCLFTIYILLINRLKDRKILITKQ